MIQAIILFVVVVSSIWIYWDATSKKVGMHPSANAWFNMSAGAWAICALLIWVIGFPAYLIKRRHLIEQAQSQPVEVSHRHLKLALIALIGVGLLLGSVMGNREILIGPSARPSAPLYEMRDGQRYGYLSADASGTIIMVGYMGVHAGHHQLLESPNMYLDRVYDCSDPCETIRVREFSGMALASSSFIKPPSNSIIRHAFDDAMNGKLEPLHNKNGQDIFLTEMNDFAGL